MDVKIYPRAVSGVFAKKRMMLVLATQAIFYGLPWINWNHRQAVLCDFATYKFYLFGIVLWPQDLIYFAIFILMLVMFLLLTSANFGRIFCGFACPEVVYSEIFFLIERVIEGDWLARKRLDCLPWVGSFTKWRIKSLKYFAWIMIALWTGFTFTGYLSPIRQLVISALEFQMNEWELLCFGLYTLMTFCNAGFLREKICKYICPYSRFQSVTMGRETKIVFYDGRRGEPRGGRSKKADRLSMALGDCVDCGVCVQVCQMGVDIRNGFQYMCIDCGACIDACNQVMKKMGYSSGLIRYARENK